MRTSKIVWTLFISLSCIYLTEAISAPVSNATAPHQSPRNGSEVYKARFASYDKDTPIFQNISGQSANPAVKALLKQEHQRHGLVRRDELPIGACAPGTSCTNGACCSKTGICGYAPEQCGKDTCISNCDAKAECGQYGVEGKKTCPINVCCSKHGFCGTTELFCMDGCQEGFGGCGEVQQPSCSGVGAGRSVGYYEACYLTLDTSIAFAFFHPTTFQITPMDPDDVRLYPQFTALKKKKASLRTWISIGGWSFNDPTNVPDTQHAFSDMASTAENRAIFIQSVLQFMRSYGFDGVDLDWEYPGAPDRGGIEADTQNFVALLQDMREAFGNRYGISVTFPASYCPNPFSNHVPLLTNLFLAVNFMTYDIHGVWDSDNKVTGPYVRPHTNLTEISQGLDLLWRNGLDPANVNISLGWYGRSFTLKDSTCKDPGCAFASGGAPGGCTKSSGTLSNAEIVRIIKKRGLTPIWDEQAAVKWISWDDQWVSYDDGQTIAQKLDFASCLCLGGKLIWAVDLDDTKGTSTLDLLGVAAEVDATVRNSCYWTFCGADCAQGYFEETGAKGQVLGIQRDTVCRGDQYQRLCCAPGTNTGSCRWDGWRGVGMPCSGYGCANPNASMIAVNTNSYVMSDEASNDLTCNGGTQSYCCEGSTPSPKFTTDDLVLVGRDGLTKRGLADGADPTCVKASTTGSLMLGGLLSLISPALGALTAGLGSLLGLKTCHKTGSSAAAAGAAGVVPFFGGGLLNNGGRNPFSRTMTATQTITVIPVTAQPTYGQWAAKANYGNAPDCAVTYTCRYGLGWDEICDNQRWAIDKALGGQTVYHAGVRGGDRTQTDYKKWRVDGYRTLAQEEVLNVPRCQVDEFPMGNLAEANGRQVVRLVNGPANGAQISGVDFQMWKSATWAPCSALRNARGLPPPPITWEFGAFPLGDNRRQANRNGQHFIEAYGFNSQTPQSLCWATYRGSNQQLTTIADHGFRALVDDPMFDRQYRWINQRYDVEPRVAQILNIQIPIDIVSQAWMKRAMVQSVLKRDLPADHSPAFGSCESGQTDCSAEADDYFVSAATRHVYTPPPDPTHLAPASAPVRDHARDEQPLEVTAARRATVPTAIPSLPLETGSPAA
ncbi:uncharacterized protein PG986_003562 [Apiospora aurea]|uniref:chitinase n=1 Tax=Apiospora aurea TaxID=335848 RepID=A0ABR1QS11_9PEZI